MPFSVWKKLAFQMMGAAVSLFAMLFKYGFRNWEAKQWAAACFWLLVSLVITDKVSAIYEKSKEEAQREKEAAEGRRHWEQLRAENRLDTPIFVPSRAVIWACRIASSRYVTRQA